jgi:hypothetical protein
VNEAAPVERFLESVARHEHSVETGEIRNDWTLITITSHDVKEFWEEADKQSVQRARPAGADSHTYPLNESEFPSEMDVS